MTNKVHDYQTILIKMHLPKNILHSDNKIEFRRVLDTISVHQTNRKTQKGPAGYSISSKGTQCTVDSLTLRAQTPNPSGKHGTAIAGQFSPAHLYHVGCIIKHNADIGIVHQAIYMSKT